ALEHCLIDVRRSYCVVEDRARRRIGLTPERTVAHEYSVRGELAPLYPEWLGDRRFTEAHGCRFPYVVGEMARGVATLSMVGAAAKAGFIGFLGAAGLMPDAIGDSLREILRSVGDRPWGSNLIHTPNEPGLERATVDLYLNLGVERVSASAFMSLTPQVVRYAC